MTTKSNVCTLRKAVIGVACSAFAGLLLLCPRASHAFEDWDPWGPWGWDAWRFQRETLSSQEEQAREAGRAKRRDELEQKQEKASAEHEAYFDAVLSASEAALRAPRGANYRIPGLTSTEGPGNLAKTLEVKGMPFLYDEGVFWIQQGSQYIVVTAPLGAVVDGLPSGAVKVSSPKGPLYYYFGTFFAPRVGAFEVVKPPAGTVVYYLPDGYSVERAGEAPLYRFGDWRFQPVFVQGVFAYKVVEPSGP